jgi:hypothetical protein
MAQASLQMFDLGDSKADFALRQPSEYAGPRNSLPRPTYRLPPFAAASPPHYIPLRAKSPRGNRRAEGPHDFDY